MSEENAAAELREKILSLTCACPKGKYSRDCPFQMFAGLSYQSRRNVLARMAGFELRKLFDLPMACDCPADPREPADLPRPFP